MLLVRVYFEEVFINMCNVLFNKSLFLFIWRNLGYFVGVLFNVLKYDC